MLAKGVLFSRRWDYYLYFQVFVFFVICALYTCKAEDYARLLDPPPRGGLWRHGYSVLADHRDGNVNCGGQKVQWIVNRGKCGVCGDAANGPQDHDNGGKFDERITVRRLLSGAAFNVSFILSQNISGMLIIQVCPMHNSREPLTEDCFKSNTLSNKEEESLQAIHVKNTQIGKNLPHTYELVLPRDLICEHCVLRWMFMKGEN
ncbi:hypothetical protein FSP39_010882 [Pinctada imbricata]|uniref:Chitin-binding type-4 domain-containing protein n=1 Tax=Pinctada imbricata TaxID=66713 RepID=A0AA88Y3D5_PINIB|nr:hypothetical protein FSP39_010882 [Pinctada imbricata]